MTQQQAQTKTQEQTAQQEAPRPEMREERPRGQNTALTVPEAIKGIQTFFTSQDLMLKIASHCKTDVAGVERIVRGITNVVRKAPPKSKLHLCTHSSFVNCIYDAHAMGMQIDGRGHCYLVPYQRPDGAYEATVSPGYKGYINRLIQGLDGCDVQVFLLWEKDEFHYSSANGVATYTYKPEQRSRSDFGNVTDAFCYISYFVNGQPRSIVETMDKAELAKIRAVAKSKDIWDAWTGEQLKKSMARRACKMRFAHLVDDLDLADNEHFEMELTGEGDTSPTSAKAKADRFRQKAADKKYNPFPEDAPVINAEFTTIPGGAQGEGTPAGEEEAASGEGADNAQNPQSDAQNGDTHATGGPDDAPPAGHPANGDDPAAGQPPASPVAAAELYQNVPTWDGKVHVGGKAVWQGEGGINPAYTFMVTHLAKLEQPRERQAMLSGNETLMATLYREQRSIWQAVVDMAGGKANG